MGLFDFIFGNKKEKELQRREKQQLNAMKQTEAEIEHAMIMDANKAYESSLPIRFNPETDEIPDYSAIAKNLYAMIDNKKYFSLLDCLDKITPPDGAQLFVQGRIATGQDERCKLLLRLPDGRISDQIFDFLMIEPSSMGAWQASLLHTLWHYLPLFGHGIYNARTAIFCEDDVRRIRMDNGEGIDAFAINSIFDYSPEVREKDGKYYVSCLYWSDYEGLVREYSEITFDDKTVTKVLKFSIEVLYPYISSVRF